ncbi:MAG: hypothetical protein HYX69_17020 [Planctomycetia bacterium]|nr:hypothetical protein [Planctomycetia bacterium]
MNDGLAIQRVPLSRLSKIRDLLDLIGAIRGITSPPTTAEGLRQVLALVLRLADLVGIDPTWTERLAAILRDDGVFNIVLAIVQFLMGAAGKEQADNTFRVRVSNSAPEVVVDEQSFAAWLPLVIQLLALLRQIRGDQ